MGRLFVAALGALAIGAAFGAVGTTFGATLALSRRSTNRSDEAQAERARERDFSDDMFHGFVFLLLAALINVRHLQAERGKSECARQSSAAAAMRIRREKLRAQLRQKQTWAWKLRLREPNSLALRFDENRRARARQSPRRAGWVRVAPGSTAPFQSRFAGNNTARTAPPTPDRLGATTNQAAAVAPRLAKFCPKNYAPGEYALKCALASN